MVLVLVSSVMVGGFSLSSSIINRHLANEHKTDHNRKAKPRGHKPSKRFVGKLAAQTEMQQQQTAMSYTWGCNLPTDNSPDPTSEHFAGEGSRGADSGGGNEPDDDTINRNEAEKDKQRSQLGRAMASPAKDRFPRPSPSPSFSPRETLALSIPPEDNGSRPHVLYKLLGRENSGGNLQWVKALVGLPTAHPSSSVATT
ncbi:hypothetical protein BKA56DRAFT_614410 [Ilyonectria sp. MPI-CAGE-AT-0026]|nr:hypothetical protein BKA56DRAFT_614410 [Ilyonectria sp. MPI-CAGE-AT-0026]